ncbi:MAG TPA: FAD-binding protein [Acetobacteraceae bacterium]|nr:FAD-binding protein [Acetobacteraceae bacterium]
MNETFDFVVVGSGGGSMCAALLLRSLGKSVVILEKAGVVGGTTAQSGGVMWIPNNRFMAKDGVADSHERAIAYLDAIAGEARDAPGATRARRLAYVEEAPKMLDFLIAQGIPFRRMKSWPDYYDAAPGASVPGRTVVAELFDIKQLGDWQAKLPPGIMPLPAYLDEAMALPQLRRSWTSRRILARVLARGLAGKLRGKQLVGGGTALQGRMLQAALQAGADIRVNMKVEQILLAQDRAAGVLVQKDGAEWRIGARLGVLINAGGFARNQAMLDRFIPGVSTEWTSAGAGDTGEMIEEAERLGAALAQTDMRVCSQMAMVPGKVWPKAGLQADMSKPHALVVDQSAVRYVAEAGSYMDFCAAMMERNKTVPAVPSWMVVDSQFISRYMLAGSMPGAKKPASWEDSGFLRRGDTLEALATACGLDPAKLAATVARFNNFARVGRDEDFHRDEGAYRQWLGDAEHKPSPTLGTLEKAPFFAIQVFPGDVSTYGGIVTDEHARVLRADGTAIEGLYATGTSTASVMGRTSPGAGASVGPSFTWGYVAAKHAAHAGNVESAKEGVLF